MVIFGHITFSKMYMLQCGTPFANLQSNTNPRQSTYLWYLVLWKSGSPMSLKSRLIFSFSSVLFLRSYSVSGNIWRPPEEMTCLAYVFFLEWSCWYSSLHKILSQKTEPGTEWFYWVMVWTCVKWERLFQIITVFLRIKRGINSFR